MNPTLDKAMAFGDALKGTGRAMYTIEDLFAHIRALYAEVKRLRYLEENDGTCGCWRNDPQCSRCFG